MLVPAYEVLKTWAYLRVLKEGRRVPTQQVKMSITRMYSKSDTVTPTPHWAEHSPARSHWRGQMAPDQAHSLEKWQRVSRSCLLGGLGWPDMGMKEKRRPQSQCQQGHLCYVCGGCQAWSDYTWIMHPWFQVPVSDGLTSMQHVPRELQKGCLDPLNVQVLPVS